ncbi:hypothetical protein BJ742DRAFT_780694 [Cladochytrium replicatum]|nr:hypothetical protein BJ742DRAFT_780694 [Cladochytrium replicatum]
MRRSGCGGARSLREYVETVQQTTEELEKTNRIDPSIIYSAFDESSSSGPGEGSKPRISMSDSITDFGARPLGDYKRPRAEYESMGIFAAARSAGGDYEAIGELQQGSRGG